MNYSQGNEQQLIEQYFSDNPIFNTFLSIGENDGRTLSNVYACTLRMWKGVCVEPSKFAFDKLKELHYDNPFIQCINAAISNKTEEAEFHESGSHLGTGDTALLSSLIESETKKWTKERFYKTVVQCLTFADLMEQSNCKTFDLISIDTEGMDYEILSQMNLEELKCSMLIVEWNGVDEQKYKDYAAKFGLSLYGKNGINLIFAK